MKILCPQCERLGELDRFRLEGTTLVVTCTRCNAEHRVEAAKAQAAYQSSPTPAPAARPSAPPPLRTVSLASAPNASNVVMLRSSGNDAVERAARAAQSDGPFVVPPELCPKCIAPRSATATSCPQCGLGFEQFSPATVAPSDWLAGRWLELLAAWGDDAKHDALRVEALGREELVALARLYRLRLAAMPEDPYAQRGREEVLRMAAAPVTHRPPTGEPPERTNMVKLVLAVLLLLGALGLAGVILAKAGLFAGPAS